MHQTDFLEATPGVDPNLPFVRALRAALSNDHGTVFRWAAHEYTVLNQIRMQLLNDPRPSADRNALIEFIESITMRKSDKAGELIGKRSAIDLCELAEKHFFHPSTRDSSSLKKVLPALMASSDFLRQRYSAALFGSAEMPRRNLTTPVAWWGEADGKVCDPYDLLPPVFSDVNGAEQAAMDAGVSSELQHSGAAMAAYARLQYEDLDDVQRNCIQDALLRYCELDTLAMVMAVQAWQDRC